MKHHTAAGRRVWQIEVLVGLLLALAPMLSMVPAGVARAAIDNCIDNGTTVTCTFDYTGDTQTWDVPAEVTQATFDVYGASGGVAGAVSGGSGGRATATITLSPGAEITIVVGGEGESAANPGGDVCGKASTAGGFSGGGNSGISTSTPPCPGGGGGGASDIRIGGTDLAHRVLVAGGGGGAANWNVYGGQSTGGAGGGLIGGPGLSALESGFGGQGGNQDCSAGSGQAGVGSAGADANVNSFYKLSGGGGGGGWCGGQGGRVSSYKSAGGGGGGSGYGPAGVVFETGVQTGDGKVIITYTMPDTTPPTTTATFSNGYVSGAWTNQPVTVTLSGVDNTGGSGVAKTYYAINNPACDKTHVAGCTIYSAPFTVGASGGDGTTTIIFFSVDVAGNVETPQTTVVSLDFTAPVANPTTSGPLGQNGWHIGDVTVTWHWSDESSGIDATQCPATGGASQDGATTITGSCHDKAGNVGSASVTVGIDRTPPTVTYGGNAGVYGVDQQVTITCLAADATSGVATTTCQGISGPAWSFGLGSHSYSATATDKAGNVGSGSTTFTVGVTYDSLRALTRQFVTNPWMSSMLTYQLSGAEWAEQRHVTRLQSQYLDIYKTMVWSMRGHGLTTQQAQLLIALANTL